MPILLVTLVAACGGDSPGGNDQSTTITAAPTTAQDGTPESTTVDVPDNTETTVAATVAPEGTTTSEEAATPATDSSTTTTTDPAGTTDTTVEPTTTTSSTTTTIPEPDLPPSPLTGLGVEDPELLNRRTMAVKVDNHWDGRPQAGIGEAEAVFELLVESGITRFMALFHTVDSSAVGPVRSVRPTDPHLLRHFNATLLTSGGQNWILRMFPRNGVGVIGEIGVGGYRDDSRSAPHDYIVNTAEFRAVADQRLYPNTAPPPLFEFGDLPSDAILGAVSRVQMEWAADNVISWRWNGTQWERHLEDGPHYWIPSGGEEGTAAVGSDEEASPAQEVRKIITADTLVVLFSRLFYTRPPEGGGYALPTMETTGGGRALLFSQGQVVEGRWEREGTTEPFTLLLEDGSPITVPPGRPWLSLFPEGRPVTW